MEIHLAQERVLPPPTYRGRCLSEEPFLSLPFTQSPRPAESPAQVTAFQKRAISLFWLAAEFTPSMETRRTR